MSGVLMDTVCALSWVCPCLLSYRFSILRLQGRTKKKKRVASCLEGAPHNLLNGPHFWDSHSFYWRHTSTLRVNNLTAMEQHGNTTTFNIENVLFQNIQRSLYYKDTAELLETGEQVIDEAYENVDHIEPWMSGNARGPSTAFCLVYRLGLLKPSMKVVKDMLDHKDSPYIRAVGKRNHLQIEDLHGDLGLIGNYMALAFSAGTPSTAYFIGWIPVPAIRG